jgi:hypothetical protein
VAACSGDKGQSPTTPSSTPTPVKTFTLSGQVTDSLTGAGIAGALVAVADGVNAGKSTSTGQNGDYTLTNLQQAGFTVNVTVSGYVAASKGVTLTANATLSFQMQHAGPRSTFDAGTYRVGTDISSGRYFTNPSDGCYWERLSGLGGTLGEIIANDFVAFDAAQVIVDIRSSDLAFHADNDCGTWSRSAQLGLQSSVKPGFWLVGSQVKAGTYRTTAKYGCYWERLRDFTGNLSGIIANDFVSSAGSELVTIRSTDTGFSTDGDCGTWTRISGIVAEGADEASGDIEASWAKNREKKGLR